MRHVRMLGLGLIATLVISAFGAGSALAKDPYTVNTWQQYKHCPVKAPGITDCFAGITLGGVEGGFFQYGHVMVKLSKSITLQGGYKNLNPNVEVIAPEDGAKLLESPEEPITKGIKVITPEIQKQAEWPEALRAAFSEAVKNKETKASVIVETAGDECTTVPGCINTESLVFEEVNPPAFRLPLKVTVVSPFLEKLGGGPCRVGSDENPIHINLVTAGAGRPGVFTFEKPNFEQFVLAGSQLVDTGWHIPEASGANGCGGEYESYVDKALNLALEVEGFGGYEVTNRTGIVVLTGNLHDGIAENVEKHLAEGSK